MIFWVFAIAVTMAVGYALARPLFGSGESGAEVPVNAAAYDVAVFKSQLREVERELARGCIAPEEAEAVRAEVGRRLLAADKRLSESVAPPLATTGGSMVRIAASTVLIAGLGLGVYVYSRFGDPSNPDMPLALRQTELQLAGAGGPPTGGPAGQAGDLDVAAADLKARLEAGDGGPEDWVLLARTEMMRGDFAASAAAYEEALQAFPDDPVLTSAYGEVLVIWADGQVTDRALSVFQRVAAIEPGEPRAQFYLGVYDRQQGRMKDALDRWVSILSAAGPDALWAPMVSERAQELADQIGVDLATLLPFDEEGFVGPSQDDIAAAMEITNADRQAMIEGMVEDLSARLEKDPMDFDGWMRLIRSRTMLYDQTGAQQALDAAAGHFARAPVPMRMLAELAAELDLTSPGEASTEVAAGDSEEGPRGPSAEDIAAAQSMEDADRQTMIEGMVENLAARLANETDDLEGWVMLARPYAVLGRIVGSLEALEQASSLAPDNPDLLIDRARMMRSLAGDRQTPETVVLMAQVAEMDPENTEALWFLGLNAYRTDDRATARTWFDRALKSLPDDAPERVSLALEVERLFAQPTAR